VLWIQGWHEVPGWWEPIVSAGRVLSAAGTAG
jgi:hypothetical protein